MSTLIVAEAKQHQVRLPIEYESALKQLAACETLDETLYWRDKSEALAAWAKIYGDRALSLQARRLKLYAYRRMGILARQLRQDWKPGSMPGRAGGGAAPGVPALLREKGLRLDQANAASAIAKMPEGKFKAIVDSPNPPSPSQLLGKFEDKCTSLSWRILSGAEGGNSLSGFKCFCSTRSPILLAKGLRNSELEKARRYAQEAIQWLHAFVSATRK